MFTSVTSRSASAYHRINVETAVSTASPHQLINMLLEKLLLNVGAARVAMSQGDTEVKGKKITNAVRIISEGLKPALNLAEGGELAANLNDLYAYCLVRLTQGNLHNDDAALAEVIRVIEPIADGWRQIGTKASAEQSTMH